jgi:hypothetical protein
MEVPHLVFLKRFDRSACRERRDAKSKESGQALGTAGIRTIRLATKPGSSPGWLITPDMRILP